jgi:hypothetical protein
MTVRVANVTNFIEVDDDETKLKKGVWRPHGPTNDVESWHTIVNGINAA